MTAAESGTLRTSPFVVRAAATLIALQLVVSAYVAGRGYFYWDDLILAGRGVHFPLWSAELLRYDHDGHFMPAAFFVAGLFTRIAPYQWAVPAVALVVGQALASAALLRTLHLILGWRRALLVPLIAYLFIPLTLPAYSWWSAALNALPLQIALAWVTGDAIKLYRTGNLRFVISGTAMFVVALLFFEKAVLVPFVAVIALALYLRTQRVERPLRTALAAGRKLWTASAVVLAAWATLYVSTVQSPVTESSRSMSAALFNHSTWLGVLPTLLGGPWRWERWIPGPAWADPPTVLVIAAPLALLAALVVTLRNRIGSAWIWSAAAGYLLLSVVAMTITRADPNTTYELAQTLRYFTDSALVFAVAIALILASPRRVFPSRRALTPNVRRAVGACLATLFIISSLGSTVTFVDAWRESPTRDYLTAVRISLSDNTDAPLLDQEVPFQVLLPVAYPNNLASRVLAPLRDRPEFASSTPVLRTIDDAGHIVDAEVTWTRRIPEANDENCAGRPAEPRLLALDGPLTDWGWTIQLNYLASSDGTIDVGLESGEQTSVPITSGLHSAFVRLVGSGSAVRIEPRTAGLSLCFGAGQVGVVVPTATP